MIRDVLIHHLAIVLLDMQSLARCGTRRAESLIFLAFGRILLEFLCKMPIDKILKPCYTIINIRENR